MSEQSTRIEDNRLAFVSPITARWQEVFYSSIPVIWQDRVECVTCLPCARDTFAPPEGEPLIVEGEVVR